MDLIQLTDDVWVRKDLILVVERNTTSGDIEVNYVVGSNVATLTVSGISLENLMKRIQPSGAVNN